MNLYIDLFISFLKIGMFSIGGGYAALPLIKEQVVSVHGWLTISQFTDLISISEMTPGPIAVNSATFVGLQIAGFPGAIIATLGNLIPSFIIVSILAYVYYRFSKISVIQGVISGLRPTVVALIGTAGFTILLNALSGSNQFFNAALLVGGLVLLRKFDKSPVLIIVLSGLAGVLKQFLLG